jgi:hypothetical protein
MLMDTSAHMIDIHNSCTYGYRSDSSELLKLDAATSRWIRNRI